MQAEYRSIDQLKNWDKNPRGITTEDFTRLKKQIEKFGQYKPLLITEDGTVLGGNMRLRAYRELGVKEVWVSVVDAPTEQQKLEYALSDNDRAGYYENQALAELILQHNELDQTLYKVDLGELTNLHELLQQFTDDEPTEPSVLLADKFLIPPFSVIDTRKGEWQERKKKWINIGIKSEVGRTDQALFSKTAHPMYYIQKKKWEKSHGRTIDHQEYEPIFAEYIKSTATSLGVSDTGDTISVFDPALCEVLYKWFNVEHGKILDPFAGGSVRGIVAEVLGFPYTGIDLSEKQIIENRKQAAALSLQPTWHVGDSNQVLDTINDTFDFVFSCPPYDDLEVYSDDPHDLSTMSVDDFDTVYKSIIAKSVAKLKDNRFACFVVGEVRGKDGTYNNFVPRTIQYFKEAGAQFYNEIILVNSVAGLAIRCGRTFQSTRKVGKTHQNILVFYKGDTRKIKEIFKEIEIATEEPSNDLIV